MIRMPDRASCRGLAGEVVGGSTRNPVGGRGHGPAGTGAGRTAPQTRESDRPCLPCRRGAEQRGWRVAAVSLLPQLAMFLVIYVALDACQGFRQTSLRF